MMRESLYGAERPLAELITLKGKSALITGSASGIGKAIATRFANAGADILLVDIDEKKLKATKGELQKKMATVDYYKVDLSKKKFAIVVAEWNEEITEPLFQGASQLWLQLSRHHQQLPSGSRHHI